MQVCRYGFTETGVWMQACRVIWGARVWCVTMEISRQTNCLYLCCIRPVKSWTGVPLSRGQRLCRAAAASAGNHRWKHMRVSICGCLGDVSMFMSVTVPRCSTSAACLCCRKASRPCTWPPSTAAWRWQSCCCRDTPPRTHPARYPHPHTPTYLTLSPR